MDISKEMVVARLMIQCLPTSAVMLEWAMQPIESLYVRTGSRLEIDQVDMDQLGPTDLAK